MINDIQKERNITDNSIQKIVYHNCVQQLYVFNIKSIISNTVTLLVSSITMNSVVVAITVKSRYSSTLKMYVSMYLVCTFIVNQVREIKQVNVNVSTNTFCSSFLLIDSVHFTHIICGLVGTSILLLRSINFSGEIIGLMLRHWDGWF
jgi:heme/copper-type cytochrome/quinol oxidase subunit 3